jgi:hypothetical protein
VRRLAGRAAIGLGGLLLALAILTCAKALLTAPPGSSLTLFANPPFISANGGVSVISAFCIEPAGMPCPDGTVIQCFTTLGRVDPQAQTKDGVARFNLVSDSRSGTATVTCVSGGPAVAASTPPSSTTPSSTTPSSTLPAAGGGGTSGSGSASTPVVIGSALPAQVVVVPQFPRIDGPGGQTRVVATVYDASGNPVANVPVIFTVAPAGACGSTEFFDSGGQPIYTDTNGQAADVMHTRRPSTDPVVVTVTATAANGKIGTTMVTINAVPVPAPSPTPLPPC